MSFNIALAPVRGVPVASVDSGEQMKSALAAFDRIGVGAIINGHALANALFTFSKSALMDAFLASGSVDVATLVPAHGLDHRHSLGLMRYFVTQGLFEEKPNEMFVPTERGKLLSPSSLGMLQMYVGGYGNLMEQSQELLERKVAYGKDLSRVGHWVGLGANRLTHSILDEVPYRVVESKGLRRVADLGCGAGHFLIDFVRRNPSHSGVGIDLSPEVIELARKTAKDAGLEDRVHFEVGDCFEPKVLALHCKGVEVFFAFAMEHELLRDGETAVLDHIDGMSEAFPGRRYLLGEPMLNMTDKDGMFYWIHVLSHQGFPRNVAGWCELLTTLRKAKLEHVYLPDHTPIGAYFDLAL